MRWNHVGTLIVAAAFLLGGWWLGQLFGPRGLSPDEVAELVRRAGDSAVVVYRDAETVRRAAAVALGNVPAGVARNPTLVVKVRTPADTVRIIDTVVVAPQTDSVLSVPFPDLDTNGISISDTVTLTPAPSRETRFSRSLHVTWNPDTLTVALLRDPAGFDRVVAALGERQLAVVEAVRSEKVSGTQRRWGLRCVVGPGAGVGMDGVVRATIGVACGLGK